MRVKRDTDSSTESAARVEHPERAASAHYAVGTQRRYSPNLRLAREHQIVSDRAHFHIAEKTESLRTLFDSSR